MHGTTMKITKVYVSVKAVMSLCVPRTLQSSGVQPAANNQICKSCTYSKNYTNHLDG